MRVNTIPIFLIALITVNILTVCHAKSIHDLLKPTKNTFDWLECLEVLDSLENPPPASIQSLSIENLNSTRQATESSQWLKERTKEFHSLTKVQITDQLSIKPAKLKAKPYESPGSQKGYGLKFKYVFK
jgi:hypothetical protein